MFTAFASGLGLDLTVGKRGFTNLIAKHKPTVLDGQRRGVGDMVRERLVIAKADGTLLPRDAGFHHIAAIRDEKIVFECAHPDFFLAPDELEMVTAAETPPTIASPMTPPPTSRHDQQVNHKQYIYDRVIKMQGGCI